MTHRPFLFLLFLWLACFGPALSQAAEVGFRGSASYQLQGNRLYLRINKVSNERSGGYTGTLKFDLWATSYTYRGGSISGYTLGSFTKEGLSSGYYYTNLVRELRGKRPPAGSYSVTLTLSEYQNGAYRIVDYITFSDRAQFYPQQPAGKPLALVGASSYRYSGNTLNLNVNQVANRRQGGYSGTLLLRLWATPYRYRGGSLNGYVLGSYKLGNLNGGHNFNKISRQVPLSLPPPGSYYVTMTLSEYRGDEYVIADYHSYPDKATFTAPKKAPPKPIQLVGTGGYAIEGSQVVLNCDKIANQNPDGTSGTLKLRLMATPQPYQGGTLTGFTLGSLTKEPLKGGFVYAPVKQSVPFDRPPPGSYHLSLVLSEYRDNQYTPVDYIAFEKKMDFAPEKPPVAPLRFVGNGGYSYKDDRLTLTCDKIVNEAASGRTGTLQVQLWATDEPYRGGGINGHLLGSIRRDGLESGKIYQDLDEQTELKRPPAGSYHMSLLLLEYDGEEYLIKDHIAFDNKREFTDPEPPAKPLRFVGYSSYAWNEDKVTIKCDKISNTAEEGETGPLQIRLWATEKPYAGGPIDGYVLATFDKDPLKAGYYYDEIEEELDGKHPPKGKKFSKTLTLSEKRGDEYIVVDYITFD
jgi:hypothetical protein